MELNPEHSVTTTLRDHWHKVVAIILAKYELNDVLITPEDINKIQNEYGGFPVVVASDQSDGLHIYLTDMETAQAMKSGTN